MWVLAAARGTPPPRAGIPPGTPAFPAFNTPLGHGSTGTQANPFSPPLGSPLVVDMDITTAGDASSPETITSVSGTIRGKAITSFQNGISATFWFDGSTGLGLHARRRNSLRTTAAPEIAGATAA